jgi:hypothetical protein
MQITNFLHDEIIEPLIRLVKSLLKVELNYSMLEFVLANPGAFRKI